MPSDSKGTYDNLVLRPRAVGKGTWNPNPYELESATTMPHIHERGEPLTPHGGWVCRHCDFAAGIVAWAWYEQGVKDATA